MNIVRFEKSVHSSKDAAKVIGCELDQIVKTIVLHDKDFYFVVILSGESRINYSRIKKLLNIARPNLATPQKVLALTGCPVGGVKPIFRTNLKVIMDERITKEGVVYGGGGDANTIMVTTPHEIIGEMNPIIWNISE